MENIFGFLFYLVLIGSFLFYLGTKIGLLIAKILLPSLPTKFASPSWSFFVCLGLACILIFLFTILLDTLGLNIILRIPEWAPFYGVVRPQGVAISLFITLVIASMITELFFAWRYAFLQKRTKTNGSCE